MTIWWRRRQRLHDGNIYIHLLEFLFGFFFVSTSICTFALMRCPMYLNNTSEWANEWISKRVNERPVDEKRKREHMIWQYAWWQQNKKEREKTNVNERNSTNKIPSFFLSSFLCFLWNQNALSPLLPGSAGTYRSSALTKLPIYFLSFTLPSFFLYLQFSLS